MADGLIPGPRLQVALVLLSQTGGHGDGWMVNGDVVHWFPPYPGMPEGLVDGREAMRRKVRELVRAGADVIKVATTGGVLSPADDHRHAHFRADELAALVAEADAAGRWVMAHAQASEGIKAAVRAGIRSIEHGIYLDDEAIELMLDRDTWAGPHPGRPARGAGRRRGRRADAGRRAPVGARGRRGPRRLVQAGGGGRGQGHHGDRQRGHPARPQPGGAGADGRRRDAGGRGALEPATLPGRVTAVWQDGRLVTGSPEAGQAPAGRRCFGNASFAGAVIWGRARCVENLRTRGEEQREAMRRLMPEVAAELAAVGIVPPDRPVADADTTLDVGGRPVQLR